MTKGYASGLFNRAELVEQYGRGQWRIMPRFMVQQPCGKLRCIDDGARGLHNHATGAWETIFTTSADFLIAAVMELIVLALVIYCAQDPNQSLQVLLEVVPEWLQLLLGLSDLVDAYRQCPSDPQQAQYM